MPQGIGVEAMGCPSVADVMGAFAANWSLMVESYHFSNGAKAIDSTYHQISAMATLIHNRPSCIFPHVPQPRCHQVVAARQRPLALRAVTSAEQHHVQRSKPGEGWDHHHGSISALGPETL